MKTKPPKNGPREAKAGTDSKQTELIDSPAPASAEPAVDAGGERIAVAIYLDDKGKIQWDRMREKTKEQLRDILNNPDIARVLGTKLPDPVAQIFNPSWTGTIIDALGVIEATLISKLAKIPYELAQRAFKYSDSEKELVGEPLVRVLNKYASKYDFLVVFKDEIALVMIVAALTHTKFMYARQLAEDFKIKNAKAVSPITEIRTTSAPEDSQSVGGLQ